MRGRQAALLAAVVLWLGLCGSAAAQSPLERWTQANRQVIVQLRDAKKRSARQRAFAETLARLGRERMACPGFAAPHDPKQVALAIVSDSHLFRFMRPDGVPAKTWWERALDWLGERWSQIVRLLFGRAAVPVRIDAAIADVLLTACILIFAAMLVRVLWLYGRRTRPASQEGPIAQTAGASELVAQSLAAAQRGAFAAAVAQLFAAGVALLKVHSQFDEQRSETVGELRRRVVARDPKLTQPFEELALALTQAIYAERPLDATDWRQSLAAYRQLEALL